MRWLAIGMLLLLAFPAPAYVHREKAFAPSLSKHPPRRHSARTPAHARPNTHPKKRTAPRATSLAKRRPASPSRNKKPTKVSMRRVIVIDPGHGGQDPGATGPHGIHEKTVTLAIALQLGRKLKQQHPEWTVILTRTNDKTLTLPFRTQLANRAHADLFISIHANAHEDASAKGIETYYLDVTQDRYAQRLALRENATSQQPAADVQFILADLSTKAYTAQSVRLSEMIQRMLVTGLQHTWRGVYDLGVKSALFHVLLGAKMPAVLVETAFISNPTEEKRLNSSLYQSTVAHSLAGAIDGFMNQRQAKQ